LYEQTPGSQSARKPAHLGPATSKDDLHSLPLPSPKVASTPGDLTPRIFQAKRNREKAEKEKVRIRNLNSRQRLKETSDAGRAHLLRHRPLADPRTDPAKAVVRKPRPNIPKLGLSSLSLNQKKEDTEDTPVDTSYIPVVPYNPSQARKTNDFIDSLKSQKNFIDIFAKPDSFMYLQRVSLDSAYDFVIVPHEVIMESAAVIAGHIDDPYALDNDPNTPYAKDHRVHYTLSANGITSNVDGDVEFISLDAFEREYQVRTGDKRGNSDAYRGNSDAYRGNSDAYWTQNPHPRAPPSHPQPTYYAPFALRFTSTSPTLNSSCNTTCGRVSPSGRRQVRQARTVLRTDNRI
jgi:hypothetical protein